jgi:hypothetical protein
MQITHDPGLIMLPENPDGSAETRAAGHGADLLQGDEAVRIQIDVRVGQRLLHHEVVALLINADDLGGMGSGVMQDDEFFHRLHQQCITHGHFKTLAVWVAFDLECLAEPTAGVKREEFIDHQPICICKGACFSAGFKRLEGA